MTLPLPSDMLVVGERGGKLWMQNASFIGFEDVWFSRGDLRRVERQPEIAKLETDYWRAVALDVMVRGGTL